MKNVENRLKNIANLLKTADKNLSKANKLLDSFISEIETSFEDVPGVLGIFDGTNMVDAAGKVYEINPNYVAKSLLIAGDNLKMVENENHEMMFKQVSKVPRRKLTGILNKKEGKWYALTDAGSYRILDVAVEFRKGEINDEVTVLVPEENLNVEWAALESMAKDIKAMDEKKPISAEVSKEVSEEETVPVKKEKKEIVTPKKEHKAAKPAFKKEDNRPVIKPPRKAKSTKSSHSDDRGYDRKPKQESTGITVAEVNTLLGDDDLR